MIKSNKIVTNGSEVVIKYMLALSDGTIIEDTDEEGPLRFKIGDGTMIDGLELVIKGMHKGERQHLQIEARDAFGFPSEENYHSMARSEFKEDIPLAVNQIIGFRTPTGEEVPGRILEIHDDHVLVDFNHPLAGQDLIFDVEVVDIDPQD